MRKPVFLLLGVCICFMFSCKKNILDNTGSSVYFYEGGLSNFDDAAVSFTGDTTIVTFSVILNPSSIKENLTVDVAVDDAARVAYNNSGPTLLYDSLPDSCYTLAEQSAVIKSGNVSVSFSISFYNLKIDPHTSYMLPITITNAEGLPITDSLNTIYFHINGNFLSYGYSVTGTKTEYAGSLATDSVVDVIQSPVIKYFAAIGTNVSTVDYADLGAEGWQYVVTVDSAAGTLTSVVPNSIILGINGAMQQSFAVDTATYDAGTGTFHFATHYKDLAGNLRVVSETMVKP